MIWIYAFNVLGFQNDYNPCPLGLVMSVRPVTMSVPQNEELNCYFCNLKLNNEEIIFYRVCMNNKWGTGSVCEMCWRVAEEVRGWYS